MRKATLRLIPLIALGYCVAFADRVNISYAALQMNRDLHFSATAYGFGAGLFFISYAACEVPSNILLCRFGARRWLARIMVTWGLIAVGMMFVRTPMQFYSMRFLLGMSEAGFFPGVVFYLAQWFPAEIRGRAISRFYISLPISSVLMGAVAGSLLNLNGHLHLAGWQWLFLAEGIPAVVLGIAFLLFIPDGPAQARWLTGDERRWILQSVSEEQDRSVTHEHARPIARALLDPRVWQLGLFEMLMLIGIYGYIFVAPEYLRSVTHLDVARVGYILAAINLLGVPAMLLGASYSDRAIQRKASGTRPRFQDRYIHIIPACLVWSASMAVCGLSRSPGVVIAALAVFSIAFYAMQGPFWTLPTGLFTGVSSAASIAAINSIGIVGGFLGPYWVGFVKDRTGSYQQGLLSLGLPMLVGAGIMFYLRRDARRRAASEV